MMSTDPSHDDDDLQLAGEVEREKYRVDHILKEAVERERIRTGADRAIETAVPRLPLVQGVWTFPWTPSAFGVWVGMSLALLAAAVMFGCYFAFGAQLGAIGIRALLPSAFMMLTLASAYCAACCATAIEETASGTRLIEDWPTVGAWQEWGFSLVYTLAILGQAMLAGAIATFWCLYWTWIPAALVAAAVFPLMLMACLESATLVPYSPEVWRSLKTHTASWAVVYGQYFALTLLTAVFLFLFLLLLQAWSFVAMAPVVSAYLLIASRLIGRLAWCLGREANPVPETS